MGEMEDDTLTGSYDCCEITAALVVAAAESNINMEIYSHPAETQ